MMRWAYLFVLFLVTLLPVAAAGEDGLLSVQVTRSPTGNPLEGVRADVWVQGRLQSPSLFTRGEGHLEFDLRQAARSDEQNVTVTITLHKANFRRADLSLVCSLRGRSDCTGITIEMEPVAGSSTITEKEKELLQDLVSNVGVALFMLPYEQLPAGTVGNLPLAVLATSLDRAITTQIQSLEREDAAGPQLEPLPAISLVPIEKPELAIAPTNFEKLRAIGTHLSALAVISGSAFMPDASRVEVSSNFLIIPGEVDQVRQRQRVDDRGLPTPLNPFELETRLSPVWGYNTLLALGVREYALAKITKEPAKLLRVYHYLVAARSDASEREGVELSDLNTLINLIEAELGL